MVNFQAFKSLIRMWSFFKSPSKQNFGKLPSWKLALFVPSFTFNWSHTNWSHTLKVLSQNTNCPTTHVSSLTNYIFNTYQTTSFMPILICTLPLTPLTTHFLSIWTACNYSQYAHYNTKFSKVHLHHLTWWTYPIYIPDSKPLYTYPCLHQ